MAKRDVAGFAAGAQEELAGGSMLNRIADGLSGPRPSAPDEDVTGNVVTQEREDERLPPVQRKRATRRVGGDVEGLRESSRHGGGDAVPWRLEVPGHVLAHATSLSEGAYVGSTLKIPERASRWMEEYLHRKNRGRQAKDRITKQSLLALAIQRLIADIETEEGVIDVEADG